MSEYADLIEETEEYLRDFLCAFGALVLETCAEIIGQCEAIA